MPDQRAACIAGMSVTMSFDLSRLYAVEAGQYEKRDPRDRKRIIAVTDPSERERLIGLSDMFENLGLALVQWREACSTRR
jgi:hypothetical protein